MPTPKYRKPVMTRMGIKCGAIATDTSCIDVSIDFGRKTMRFAQLLTTLCCLLTVIMLSNSSHADLVYDEGALGDLSNFDTSPTALGVLAEGINDVMGTIGGTSNRNIGDGYDVFSFSIAVNKELESIFVNDYQTAGGNLSTGFNLYESDGTFLGSTGIDAGDIGSDFLALSGVGTLSAGDYYVELREFTAPGQTYSFGFSVVPEPDALFALVMMGISALMKRRRYAA